MVKLTAKGTPVISEIEFAGRYTDAKMVCITGSNGKTTTTMLTYHILREAGLDVGIAGNVGRSLALQVARDSHNIYVVELSSFQLENMYRFKANIAVMLNITPDHLDRYDYQMQNYINAKFRIIRNMQPTDAFIYWQDDPVIEAQLRQVATEARLVPFAEHPEEGTQAYIDAENELVINSPSSTLRMPRADLSLNGLHNLYNSMAAGLSASLLDVKKDDIRRALSDFDGVEHPPRVHRHGRRCALHQRLQGHQRQLLLVRARKHAGLKERGADPRRQGQRQRLHRDRAARSRPKSRP